MVRRTFGRGRTLLIVVATAAFLTLTVPALAQPSATDPPAPLLNTDQPTAIKDRYIVVLKSDLGAQVRRTVRDQAEANGAQVTQDYGTVLNAFAAALSPSALDNLRRNPNVAYIEADRSVALQTTQSPATWGLDRIDQRDLPLNNAYTSMSTGSGVTAYVIDTGIRFTHTQFGGRAVSGFDAIDGGTADDCNGHGTHVAGTIGSATYGVAKAVRLVAVRVLDCTGSGTISQVLAGLNWVAMDHQSGQPAVANMSLGGSADTAMEAAVQNAIQDGITYAVAAGNSNADACTSSPANVAAAITVGATTSTDARASYSNYGTCLDLFAPGSSITSTWFTSDTAAAILSGTSMASPHVAGVAALYLESHKTASPSDVQSALVGAATSNVVTSAGNGSPNRLLYSQLPTSPSPAPTPTSPCASYPTVRSGSLPAGGYAIEPDGNSYFSNAGTQKGCLDGPTGANFDLYLYRWNGSKWSVAASATTAGPDEMVSYTGSAGSYYWRIFARSGQGSYTVGLQHP